MSHMETEGVVTATRIIAASAQKLFDLIADPSLQPSWDGNDNLASAAPGQRVHRAGDIFVTTLVGGAVRENHVVEFIEGSQIAWLPAERGKQPPGHLWRWTLDQVSPGLTTVTHTYDYRALTDKTRLEKARATTPDKLRSSIDRLAVVVQSSDSG